MASGRKHYGLGNVLKALDATEFDDLALTELDPVAARGRSR